MRRHLKITLRFILLIVLPTIVIGGGADYWLKSTRYVKTENAYVKSHHLAVSADINGRASKILVQENDRVKTGNLLFTLDPEPYRIKVSKAEAELAGVRNTLRALRAEYHQVVAERMEARQEVLYLERVFARHKKLSARGISSKARYDEAERNLIKARQSLRSLKQKILHAIARLGGRHDTPDKLHPMFLAAKAKLDGAKLNLRRTQIRSPSNGTVGKVSLQAGEYVEEGKAVIPIIQTAEIWVEANLKETQLTHVKTKQSVLLTVDAYPEVKIRAYVASISPTTGGELSVLPPQNASGNWVKVVQRVPVRIELKNIGPNIQLRAGMTGAISIDTERKRALKGLIKSAIARVGTKG